MRGRVAIAFLTKDRVDLTKQSIKPLLQGGGFDLHIFDGSKTVEGQKLLDEYESYAMIHRVVRGGADPAVLYALTTLFHNHEYTHIGLVENDVLLPTDWFETACKLFEWGEEDDLSVGAVSLRAYEDRILLQRPRYAVMHNLGWGTQIMTREAVGLCIANMRTSYTLENRKLFAQLVDNDIGRYWAFATGEHWIVPDWGNDKILAAHGLASLALTPSPVQMLDQDLAAQGLRLATESIEGLADNALFARYVDRMEAAHNGSWQPAITIPFSREEGNAWTIFAHQMRYLGGFYSGGKWTLRWAPAYGGFAWQAASNEKESPPTLSVRILGPCEVQVTGGPNGGRVAVMDLASGFEVCPSLPSEQQHQPLIGIMVPGGLTYRTIRVVALDPGVTFWSIRTREEQPLMPGKFIHLPEVA